MPGTERDDFCPRKQLAELISSCGQPDLQLRDENCTDEPGSVHSVVDASNTLAKMLANVNEFVLKYTGEDFRKAVANEIKLRHNAQVKTFISRIANASARATEKGKTYDDLDWEKLICTNKLRNLYVSQLDLYLLRNFKLSRKDCEKKQFTKVNKVQEIKKQFYCFQSVGRKQRPQQAAHQKMHVALDKKSEIDGSPFILNVLPWGGTMTVPCQGQVILVNTSPIDNFLLIFYVLKKKHGSFFQYMQTSSEPYCTTLIRIGHMLTMTASLKGSVNG